MATKNVPSRATTPRPAPRPQRASQRVAAVCIDLAERSLRDLMTEQCRSGTSYLTVYRGTRAELVATGVPESAFPVDGNATQFQVRTVNVCCTGQSELLTAEMRAVDVGYELEIDWGTVRPYVQAGHPAVTELARMLLTDISAWTSTDPWSDRDFAQPIDMVAADPRTTDYKPSIGAGRFQVSPEFHKLLGRPSAVKEHLRRSEGGGVDLPSARAMASWPPRA